MKTITLTIQQIDTVAAPNNATIEKYPINDPNAAININITTFVNLVTHDCLNAASQTSAGKFASIKNIWTKENVANRGRHIANNKVDTCKYLDSVMLTCPLNNAKKYAAHTPVRAE